MSGPVQTARPAGRVMLVSMPFGALERQALGLSLLKAGLAQEDVPCDVRYLTFEFAEFIGYVDYQWISFELPYTAFAGDWIFTQALYGPRPPVDQAYMNEVLRTQWRVDEASIQRLLGVRGRVAPFIAHVLAAVPWADYQVVGFTSTFEQNLASLALARALKARFPHLTILFGGANWEGEMGLELHRQFPFVDYVCSGEADLSFPRLIQQLLAPVPDEGEVNTIPGVVYRAAQGSHLTGAPTLVRDLDALPMPDYSDYFAQLEGSTLTPYLSPTLLLETSRGCWWGAKSHCTFCGLNGGAMSYRSKSARRALQELDALHARWRIEHIEVVDNILDMGYFTDLLPELAHRKQPYQLFYEVKANLNRRHVEALRDAGVRRIQPGIESMSNHVLTLMRKGTSALRNIQLLKWCREYDVAADWNILYGFPGETVQDYQTTLDLLPAIRFLGPPSACGPIRLDRFSPYFEAPESFGFRNVRPIAPYRYLYPFAADALYRVAYYFDYDYASDCDPAGAAADVIAFVDCWKSAAPIGVLQALLTPDGALQLVDSRPERTVDSVSLHGPDRSAYEYCDELRSLKSVVKFLQATHPELVVVEDAVQMFLESLVANRLMVRDETHYLALALGAPPAAVRRPPPPVQTAHEAQSA
ncbi:RiPP maturation radical SAM C-methyltransferase [Deinococcus sp. SM5_A1]|uniref:RiPP maturation radical SAM C-methyltransferase n=1 Tax=Deinococcus sp. SM5_A1 TaxID=3379094 RepID=UPI00385E8556